MMDVCDVYLKSYLHTGTTFTRGWKTPMSFCIHCTPLTFLKVLSTTHFEDVGETLDKDRTSNHKLPFQKRSVVNNNLLSGRYKDDMGY